MLVISEFIEKEIESKNRSLILLTKFGSHLYGTETKESDFDCKGVFVPSKKEFYLQNYPKQIKYSTSNDTIKNKSSDIDIEIYSIHKFFELAIKGETVAIDLLHVTKNLAYVWDIHWDIIHNNRKLFYCKDLKAFLDYCKRQAAKYGVKGSRIAACEELIDLMNTVSDDERMEVIWTKLPMNKHTRYRYDLDGRKIKYYECCGKVIQNTSKVGYSKKIYLNYLDKYGKRAKLARKNENIDWKAISHALRAGYELLHLYKDHDFTFPLSEADFLRDVKVGNYDFNYIQKVLESLMEEVEMESKKCKLPQSVDINIDKINRLLYNVVSCHMVDIH